LAISLLVFFSCASLFIGAALLLRWEQTRSEKHPLEEKVRRGLNGLVCANSLLASLSFVLAGVLIFCTMIVSDACYGEHALSLLLATPPPCPCLSHALLRTIDV
jgi:hypothetical protein